MGNLTNLMLERNLRTLAGVDKSAAEAIRAASAGDDRIANDTIANDCIVLEKTKSGESWTGCFYDEQGRKSYLASRYRPAEEAAKRLGQIDFGSRFLYIIIGFGLGYELQEILKRKDRRAVIILVEPRPDLMRTVLETVPLQEILSNRNIFWAIGDRSCIQEAFLRHSLTLAQFFNTVEIIEHPVLGRNFKDLYADLRQTFFNAATYTLYLVGNDPHDTLIGIENAFANLKSILISDSLTDYFGALDDRPVIIIMAGPSLDDQLPVLKKVDRDQVIMLCPDIILQKLLDEGVVPHIVFTIERLKQTFEEFYLDRDIPEVVWFAGQPVVDPRTLDMFKGRTFLIFRSATYFERWLAQSLGNMPMLECGVSVAHMVFSTARALGCSPIILVGQDLCYHEEGHSYTANTYRHDCTWEDDVRDKIGLTDERPLEVPAIGGGTVATRRDWWLQWQWLEVEVGLTDVPVIDVKKCGTLIKGTVLMPLAEALKRYCRGKRPEPFVSGLDTGPAAVEKRLLERVSSLDKALSKEIEKNHQVLALLEKGCRCTQDLARSFQQASERENGLEDLWSSSSEEIKKKLNSVYYTIEPIGVEPTLTKFVLQPLLFQFALKRTPNLNISTMQQAFAWQEEQESLLMQMLMISSLAEEQFRRYLDMVRSIEYSETR